MKSLTMAAVIPAIIVAGLHVQAVEKFINHKSFFILMFIHNDSGHPTIDLPCNRFFCLKCDLWWKIKGILNGNRVSYAIIMP